MLDFALYNSHLRTQTFGRNILSEETYTSTNQVLLNCADNQPEGTVCTCEQQTAGRGRHRRLWHSPPGRNLYFSLLVKPQLPPWRFPQLAMLTALGVHRALRQLLPTLSIDLKWPNDLWYQGRKLSGILCECTNSNDAAVIGIGLNVNSRLEDFPPELQDTAASLFLAANQPIPREILLAETMNQLEEIYKTWLSAPNLTPFQDEWNQYDLLQGKVVTVTPVDTTIVGRVTGIDANGFLLLTLPDGTLYTASAGDIHIGRNFATIP